MSESRRYLVRAFESRSDASEALAIELEDRLKQAIDLEGEASLVVSGGTSPAVMFQALRDLPLPWMSVTIVPSDERDVPPDHPDRNDAMIRRELLSGRAAGARLVSLIPAGDIPDRFNAVVLGMGNDGHTASLFPGSPDLQDALQSGQKLERLEVPQLDMHRVSLTPSALLDSDWIYLLFFGEDKRAVFEAALGGTDSEEYPIRAILQQDKVPVVVYWAP
jgi:6-phosphogluconolactonase